MSQQIMEAVKAGYGAVAQSGLTGEHAGVRAVAEAFGYSPEDLAAVPAAANMGLSCGNPTATANLRPGEVVVDLGCGGGMDVFLAAGKVGPTGKAIGIDMTADMVERARSPGRSGPARAACGPARAARRQRARGEREGVRGEAVRDRDLGAATVRERFARTSRSTPTAP